MSSNTEGMVRWHIYNLSRRACHPKTRLPRPPCVLHLLLSFTQRACKTGQPSSSSAPPSPPHHPHVPLDGAGAAGAVVPSVDNMRWPPKTGLRAPPNTTP